MQARVLAGGGACRDNGALEALHPMPKFIALIPAAGGGSRLGSGRPKQYLELAGHPLLFHAVRRLALHPLVEQVFVVLARGDAHFSSFDWRAFAGKLTPLYCGGETRAASVFNGLLAADDAIEASDWVLVHDAARPCLGTAELDRLLERLSEDETGGLLAIPVVDTLKRADREERAGGTVSREDLWQAQTPQMFRYRLLVEALRASRDLTPTDEAGAIEALGLKPRLIMGSIRNIKVTYPEDLALAELILKTQAHENRAGL
jgi:2-C-methyl-D-erythritol 4-phosphate cytidylyltransferase